MPELRANFFYCDQGSPEWLALRAGRGTSSRIADATSFLKRKSKGKDKGDETQARADYRADLIAERLSKKCVDHYVSIWMKEGKEKEPLAQAAYEMEIGELVDKIGFVLHPEIEWAGASPDALIGARGLAEYKCPKIRTHLEYLFAGVVPEDYKPQMLWQLACDPERDYNDFVSFCPELPKKYQLFIRRLARDNGEIAKMESEVRRFLSEVEDGLIKLRELREGGPSLEEVRLEQSIAQVKERKGLKAGPQLVVDALEITPEDEMAFIRGE